MFTHDGSMMAFGGGFMWIFWLVLLVAVVFVLKSTIGSNTGATAKQEDSPLDILKKRYARGDIDEEEFNQRRIELEK